MRALLVLLFSISSFLLYAQNQTITFDSEARIIENTEPVRTFFDEGVYGIQIKYSFPGALVQSKVVDSTVFQSLFIKSFSHKQDVGLPAVPMHTDLIVVPQGSQLSVQILNAPSVTYNNFLLYPALEPASDEYGADEPAFVIDSTAYQSNVIYPSSMVQVREYIKYKGVRIALVDVFPVQYIASQRKMIVHSEINYKISFSHAPEFLNKSKISEHAMKLMPNMVLNAVNLDYEIQQYLNSNIVNSSDPNFIIVTHTDYLEAADSLANWKRMMGFRPEIIVSNNWTSSQIKAAIHSKYSAYTPSPDYLVLLGDNDKVPGEIITGSNGTFATDLYYATMDGPGDYMPDMAVGRISVANSNQAVEVVQKIINYDRSPIMDSSFYHNGLNCAYFQHASNGYAERRFAQTSEEIRNHIVSRGYEVERVYKTGSTVNPLHWNNGYYSAGEPIPNDLHKPNFAWNGTATDINAAINSGRFYVFHRDHGMSSGWGDPYYTTSNMNQLNNGNKTPIVFSINCLTGKYMDAECFAEKLLRIPNGGAVGVFGHGEVSYSGYNDGLALGLVDAIWSNPGLVPTFSGSGGVSNPNLTPHTDIFKMGDVKNQGLLRMIETWGGTTSSIKYTHELLNYFGDPTTEIKTAFPTTPTLASADTLWCNMDSTLNVSSNLDGTVSLVIEDELVATTKLQNGSAILHFNPVVGVEAILTISGHNMRPISKKIVISGGCPRVKFSLYSEYHCLDDSLLVTDQSTGNIISKTWNFGSGAVPSTALGNGPFYVQYNTPGLKWISLTVVDSTYDTLVVSKSYAIDQLCGYRIPVIGNTIVNNCQGTLRDDGGDANYSNNSMGSFTISPLNASSITINFTSFNFENNYDYLKIYDGPSTSSPLIGSYSGTSLPNGGQITSTSGTVTLAQFSDSYTTMSGFEANWSCNAPSSAPISDFVVSDTFSCSGFLQFHDVSSNGPNNWFWDFGDGITSTQQHPQHIYAQNGYFTVKLKVINAFGTDSIVKSNLVHISRLPKPQAIDAFACKSGTLDLTTTYSGPGTLYWFSSDFIKNFLDTGLVYTTPLLHQTTSYYAQVQEYKASLMVGKLDNGGSGGYFNSSPQHYLVFDCYKPILLKSVEVYAGTAGNRTIELQNSGGNLIASRNVYIPAGKHRITLNFNIPTGVNYRLVGPSNPNLYRNNANLSYPYNLNNIVSIKQSSASTPLNYYYYFYNWEVVDGSCSSDRVEVKAILSDSLSPISNFTIQNLDPKIDFQNTGNYGDSYYWDFGDGTFSILENPSHTYSSNGNYTVHFTASNDCGNTTSTQTIQILATQLNSHSNIQSWSLYPNPANDLLSLDIKSNSSQKMYLNIYDLTGRLLISKKVYLSKGNNHLSLSVKELAQSYYQLELINEKGRIYRPFMKQ